MIGTVLALYLKEAVIISEMEDLKLIIRAADNPTSALDLGCGCFCALVKLLEQEQIVRLVGVDDDSQGLILEACKYESLTVLSNNLTRYIRDCVFEIPNELIKEVNRIEFIPKDIIEYLDSSSEKFDIILLRNVLHWIPDKIRRLEMLIKVKSRLNKNGLFLLRVAGKGHPFFKNRADITTYSTSQLVEEVNSAGLTVGEVFSEDSETNIYCLVK